MQKRVEKRPNIIYNSIPDQQKQSPNSVTIKEWNDFVSILKRQTNLNTEYIEKLHRLFFGDWDITSTGYVEFDDPNNEGLFKIMLDLLHKVELIDDKAIHNDMTYSSEKIENQFTTVTNTVNTKATLTPNTVTILTTEWATNQVVKTVTGVTPTAILWVSPAESNYNEYLDAEIRATAQGIDSITFTCVTVPTIDINVSIVIGGVGQ